jgi:alpha-tubulin suppressor-like RCC1 family protein
VDKLVPAATLFASATALSVSNSNKSTCVRTSAVGDVQCAGSNANGQLGTPSAYATPQAAILSTGVTTGAIGRQHSCGVVAGAVKCWGDNHLGQLGDGSTTLVSVSPLQVSGLTSGVTAVTSHASGYHSCALLSTGAV